MENQPVHNISVLFVEDNESLRFLYEKILSKKVAKVFSAENGQVGLDLYMLHKPDLVITDISMPVMDGLQMIKKIKESIPDAKVVVMSAYSNNEYFLEAINLRVDAYLLKPVDAPKLVTTLQDMTYEIVNEKVKEQQIAELLLDLSMLRKDLAEKEQQIEELKSRINKNQ